MPRISFTKHLLPLGAVVALIGLLYLVPTVRTSVKKIDQSLERICWDVGATDRESCVTALLEGFTSKEIGFREKNQMIWALGQLADPRALTLLEELQTGQPCQEPCRKDQALCQLEIEKAIKWCRGEAHLMRLFRSLTGSRWAK
jgi:hypothetical protein